MKISPATLAAVIIGLLLICGPSFLPPGPVPPVPVPVPVPVPDDPPAPVVDTNPIPGPTPGLRVLVLREAQAATSPAERATLGAPAVIEALNRLAVRNVSGQPEWRCWDDDMPADSLQFVGEHWRVAYERAKKDAGGKLPWVLVGRGTKGESVSLPGSRDEFLKLLSRYE